MKNRFFNPLWVFVCGWMLCVASCEKMVLTEEAGASLSAVTRSNAGVYTRLNFVVFDDDGERVDQINQEVGDDDFGEAHFTLPLGTYRLALVAHSAKGNPQMLHGPLIGIVEHLGGALRRTGEETRVDIVHQR